MASSLETNKLLAALLTAGIIASGSGVISRIIYHPVVPEELAYPIAAATDEGAEEAVAVEEQVPLPVLLADASPENGETVAKKCVACHSFEEGGEIKIGPPMWGVVGREVASVSGFDYSEALLAVEGEWTFEALDGFLADPSGWAPGTNMTFAGLPTAEDRAEIIVYLRALAASQVPLPEVAAVEEPAASEGEAAGEAAPAEPSELVEQAAGVVEEVEGEAADAAGEEAEEQVAAVDEQAEAEGAQDAASGDGIAALLAAADPDAGANEAKKCAACHSFEEGGPAKIGPPLWDVVGRDVAAIEDFSYSDALAGVDGAWDYAALDGFLAEPREWAPGTKMAFVGIKKPEARANLISYLRSLSNEPAPLP